MLPFVGVVLLFSAQRWHHNGTTKGEEVTDELDKAIGDLNDLKSREREIMHTTNYCEWTWEREGQQIFIRKVLGPGFRYYWFPYSGSVIRTAEKAK